MPTLSALRTSGKKPAATCKPFSGQTLKITNSKKILTSAWASFWNSNVQRSRPNLKRLRRPLRHPRSKRWKRTPPNLKKFKLPRKSPLIAMMLQLLRLQSRPPLIRRNALSLTRPPLKLPRQRLVSRSAPTY